MKTLLSTLIFLAIAQVACADNSYLTGTWLNADSKAKGITRLLFQQTSDSLTVHTYAKCAPIDCAWGGTPLTVTGPDAFQFGYVNSQGITNITAQRISDDKLQLKLTKQTAGATAGGSEEIIDMIKIPSGPNIYIKLH